MLLFVCDRVCDWGVKLYVVWWLDVVCEELSFNSIFFLDYDMCLGYVWVEILSNSDFFLDNLLNLF